MVVRNIICPVLSGRMGPRGSRTLAHSKSPSSNDRQVIIGEGWVGLRGVAKARKGEASDSFRSSVNVHFASSTSSCCAEGGRSVLQVEMDSGTANLDHETRNSGPL